MGVHYALEGQRPQLLDGRGAQLCHERCCCSRRPLRGRRSQIGAALHDRPVEKASGGGHRQQRRDFHAAAGLAEDRHVVRITAETGDVVPYPGEGSLDIEDAVYARRGQRGIAELGEMEVAHGAEAMVHCHHDHVSPTGQALTTRHRVGTATTREAAAVQPHKDWAPRCVKTRRPQVQDQAILAHRHRTANPHGVGHLGRQRHPQTARRLW